MIKSRKARKTAHKATTFKCAIKPAGSGFIAKQCIWTTVLIYLACWGVPQTPGNPSGCSAPLRGFKIKSEIEIKKQKQNLKSKAKAKLKSKIKVKSESQKRN